MLKNSLKIFVSVFVLFIIAKNGRAQSQVTCDSSALQHCLYGFIQFTGWNVSSQNALNDYTNLYNYLQNTIANVVGYDDGLLLACNGIEQFVNCLGIQNIGCISVPGRLRAGDSPTNAYGIAGTFNQYKFECGPGLFTVVRDSALTCIQRVLISSANVLASCRSTYFANIQHDQLNSNLYIKNLLQCYIAPFSVARCRRDTRSNEWWACESQYQFVKSQFPLATDICDIQDFQFEMMNEYIKSNHKVENSKHYFKMPNKWMINEDGEWEYAEQGWISV
uniref:C-type lectin domain-containing protein n=1 Tax=Strongyloides papillosus TaxID=174720 RepID=A0A0N5C4B2_STREA